MSKFSVIVTPAGKLYPASAQKFVNEICLYPTEGSLESIDLTRKQAADLVRIYRKAGRATRKVVVLG